MKHNKLELWPMQSTGIRTSIPLWDVQIVQDASRKARYFLHSANSFWTQDKLPYVDENYHPSDTDYITTIFHALFFSQKIGVVYWETCKILLQCVKLGPYEIRYSVNTTAVSTKRFWCSNVERHYSAEHENCRVVTYRDHWVIRESWNKVRIITMAILCSLHKAVLWRR